MRRRNLLLRAAIAVAVVATGSVLSPAPTSAQEPSTEEQLNDVRARSEAVANEIDVLNARDTEVRQALARIQAEVAAQQVVVNQRADALASAQAAVAESAAKITELEGQIVQLDAAADQMLIDEFVNPPIHHALDMFQADTLAEATLKNAIVDIQSQADARTIERLGTAQRDLEAEKAEQEDLAADAAAAKEESDAALAELKGAQEVQAQFATEVERRINQKLAEAAALQAQDADLARQLAAEQAAVAAALAAAEAQPETTASTVTPAPGGLADVSCPGGGSITVAGAIATNVQSLLDAANADGVVLCGGGYRDPQEQIELRMAHCGTSDYAIYEMPSSQCSPPTARPGTSMHEQGLAIDFTCNGGGTVSSGDTCFVWLSNHAADYGLYNLPSEAWHWSTNGE
jgi:LAS superfamily LD-carboxypeptidase LdcB